MASVQEHYDTHLGPVRATLNRLGLMTTIEGGRSSMVRLVARSV